MTRDRWDARYRAGAAMLGAIGDGWIELGRPGLAIHDRGRWTTGTLHADGAPERHLT